MKMLEGCLKLIAGSYQIRSLHSNGKDTTGHLEIGLDSMRKTMSRNIKRLS